MQGGPAVTDPPSVAVGSRIAARTLETVLPVPAGSVIALAPPEPGENSKSRASVTLAAPSTLTVKESRQDAQGATTHAPPAPPRPAEVAAAGGIRLLYWFAAGFAVLAIVAFFAGFPKAGALCAAGAGALPILAQVSAFVASHAAVAFACLAAGLVAAWFFVRKQLKDAPDVPNP